MSMNRENLEKVNIGTGKHQIRDAFEMSSRQLDVRALYAKAKLVAEISIRKQALGKIRALP